MKSKSVNGDESHFAPKPGCSFGTKWELKGQVHSLCCWKSVGKGKRIHRGQNFAKIYTNSSLSIGIDGSCVSLLTDFELNRAEFARDARCLFHLGLPGAALPCPQSRLPSSCIRSSSCSGFSSFSCSAGALGTLQIRSSTGCTPVEQRVAALTCRECQPRCSPASPGAGAPPPGATLGAAGAPGRAL